MTEIDALYKIAEAIELLAIAVGGVGMVLWLIFLFKSMSSNSSIKSLVEIIKTWLEERTLAAKEVPNEIE